MRGRIRRSMVIVLAASMLKACWTAAIVTIVLGASALGHFSKQQLHTQFVITEKRQEREAKEEKGGAKGGRRGRRRARDKARGETLRGPLHPLPFSIARSEGRVRERRERTVRRLEARPPHESSDSSLPLHPPSISRSQGRTEGSRASPCRKRRRLSEEGL